MNDTMSLLLATTILAMGGLGLYMYKNSDDKESSSSDDYNEDSFFGTGSFWCSNDDDTANKEDKEDEEIEIYEPKVRSRASSKTKRNRKTIGSKRRY